MAAVNQGRAALWNGSCSPFIKSHQVKAAMVETRPSKSNRFDNSNSSSSRSQQPGINGKTSKHTMSSLTKSPFTPHESPDDDDALGAADDGRQASVQDYMEQSLEIIRPDNGPPRWFCPLNCGEPKVPDAPLLLFLPGLEGTGLGLILHHKSLGELFEVRCLHIPVKDRTPFEGLLDLVEKAVRAEHQRHPQRPIYIVGDSFGGCLALSVAAANPSIDLVLVLANPATCIARSQLQPVFPLLELIPDPAFEYVPFLFSFTMGDPLRMASASIPKSIEEPLQKTQKLADALADMLPTLPTLAQILPRSTLTWRLKLIRSAAMHANSRLHAVKAQVLVLASEKDRMLPSADEARRLKRLLRNCKVRSFKDSGHTLLLEDGPRLASIIKATLFYRKSKQRDIVRDYILPTREEFQTQLQSSRTLRSLVSPVFLSTDETGRVVRGLSAISDDDRPLLFVGNHMLIGLELSLIVEEIIKEKKLLARGLAHPTLFSERFQSVYPDLSFMERFNLFGAVPVSATNFYKLLSSNASVLLYPGGAREALHKKGEEYKLFWPEQPEFVRMAARFGATIIPFSCVGEDDMVELLLDYDDLSTSILKDVLVFEKSPELRPESAGEVAKQPLFAPILAPKVPGRFYCLFGKAISTAGRYEELQERTNARELYLKVKASVEAGISYLLQKRELDPCRNILPRLLYEASSGGTRQGPSFDL